MTAPVRSNRLVRILGGSSAQARRALLVAVVFAGTQSTHALASNTADTLFFARFGVEHLPVMYIVLGFLTMAALVGYGIGLARFRRRLLYPAMLAVTAGSLVLGRLAIGLGQRWVYGAVWLVASLGVLVTLTFMWNLASDAADARSAKRLFPVFASAGILGGFIGNIATGPLTAWLGAPNVLLVAAGILAATGLATFSATSGFERAEPGRPTSDKSSMRSALAMAWSHPLLRLVAVSFLVGTALFYSVAFPFSSAVAESFDTEAEIASYLGAFAASATAVTFVFSLFLVNRLFSRLGVVGAWFLVGAAYVAGFSLWLASLTLVTASIFRFAQWVMATSVGSTARSAMFNVLSSDRRAEVMAAFAAVPAQLGLILAGVLLWAGARARPEVNTAIGLGLALVLAWSVWLMRSRYSEALVDALRAGDADPFVNAAPGLVQVEANGDGVGVAVDATQDPDPNMRRLAVEMLGKLAGADRFDVIAETLDDPDLGVRIAALTALDDIARTGDRKPMTIPTVERVLAAVDAPSEASKGERAKLEAAAASCLAGAGALDLAASRLGVLLGSDDPEMRLAAIRAITRSRWEPAEGLAEGFMANDPSQAVRAASAAAVASVNGASAGLAVGLTDPSHRVRHAAAEAWASVDGPPEIAVDLLENHPPWTWEAATVALGHRSREVRERVLAWAANQIETLADLQADRDTLAAVPDVDRLPATEYLSWLVTELVASSHRTAIRVLGLLESEETIRTVIEGMGSPRLDVRAQALEAAESMGGAMGRRVVPLLEGGIDRRGGVADVIRRLVADDSPYVRALAARAIIELVGREWSALVEPLVEDPDGLVRSTADDVNSRMEIGMAETLGTQSRMDRMLLLRRVAIFRELGPEDLDHVAELAVERTYVDGEVMLQRGDKGGDLLVIVSGSSDVGPVGGPAIQRLGPGDHVGELTALSGRLRPTDAVAVGPVRTLAISGSAFNMLILDRPEVARLILASLAERLADALNTDGNIARP